MMVQLLLISTEICQHYTCISAQIISTNLQVLYSWHGFREFNYDIEQLTYSSKTNKMCDENQEEWKLEENMFVIFPL